MSAPKLTDTQRREALIKANIARKYYRDIKRKLNLCEISLEEVLNDKMCERMKLRDVLVSLPGFGPVKSQEILNNMGISETKRLKGLGPNQKQYLLEIVIY